MLSQDLLTEYMFHGAARNSGDEGKDSLYVGFLALGVVIGVLMGIAMSGSLVTKDQLRCSPLDTPNVLTPEEAGERTADFLSNNLPLQPGTKLALDDVNEEHGLYNVTMSYMGAQLSVFITKNGNILFPSGIDLRRYTIGNFMLSGNVPCTENERPLVYFFGSDGCSGCEWEYPILINVTSKFEGSISFHDNMNNPGVDEEVFATFSPDRSIPTLVVGCTYYRIGAGILLGEDPEAQVLTALICSLTDNKPEAVCSDPAIVELINQLP